MSVTKITHYSRGYVAEYLDPGEEACSSWILLPAENLWADWLRGTLYCIALFYIFVGIAIASDIFMCSIEVITSKKKKIVKWDAEKNVMQEKEVLIWNETVANLTLMALGSSAPEILLAIIETTTTLDDEEASDSLGTFTIIGSAAFNLLLITAVCIISVPKPQNKSIKEFGVFIVTGIWSIWAYIWMLLVVKYITPEVIDPWEAWVTLAYLPVLVFMAYMQDLGWCCARKKVGGVTDDDNAANVRVVTSHPHPQLTGHHHKELLTLEAQKASRMSATFEAGELYRAARLSVATDHANDHTIHPTQQELRVKINNEESVTHARARFRHAVVGTLLGSKAFRPHSSHKNSRMADVVSVMKSWHEAMKDGTVPDIKDSLGKFTFGSDRYAVLESAGTLNIDIFFHRKLPPHEAKNNNSNSPMRPRGKLQIPVPNNVISNGIASGDQTDGDINPVTPSSVTANIAGAVSIDFETREGSAKPGKDFKYTQGTLIFNENEYRKSITIPIINDNQYQADVDFYVILKNPHGGTGIGDPSVTRVTIVDDDEPGEFEFEQSHYHIDPKNGKVTLRIMREHGFDGKVSMTYSTCDGSAKGGKSLGSNVDYASSSGTVCFEHGDPTKLLTIDVNKNVKETKNFIVSLRNPSLGALIGPRSVAMCHFNADSLVERVADALEDEAEDEPTTWGGQFVNAMTISVDNDDDGNTVEPKWYHYIMHFISFLWKLFCSLIPPTTILGAWPTFVMSLLFIGLMTAVVEQKAGGPSMFFGSGSTNMWWSKGWLQWELGKLMGCVIGIKTSVTGITIIALGTSLPDTFASRTAATQDSHADAAIGNVTGSNSVNVFLGLGLPWVISAMYHLAKGTTFRVKSDNLTQSVIIFSVVGTICLIFLYIRRRFFGGELGGKSSVARIGSSLFLFTLWVIYIVLSSLKAYDKIDL